MVAAFTGGCDKLLAVVAAVWVTGGSPVLVLPLNLCAFCWVGGCVTFSRVTCERDRGKHAGV